MPIEIPVTTPRKPSDTKDILDTSTWLGGLIARHGHGCRQGHDNAPILETSTF